jgi:hypothetical protein
MTVLRPVGVAFLSLFLIGAGAPALSSLQSEEPQQEEVQEVPEELKEEKRDSCEGKRGQDQAICLLEQKVGSEVDCSTVGLRGNERALCLLVGNRERREARTPGTNRRTHIRARRVLREGLANRQDFGQKAEEARERNIARQENRLEEGTVRGRVTADERRGRRALAREALRAKRAAITQSDQTTRGAGRLGRRAIERRSADTSGAVQLRSAGGERPMSMREKRVQERQMQRTKGTRVTQKRTRERLLQPPRIAGTEERRVRQRGEDTRYREVRGNAQKLLLRRNQERHHFESLQDRMFLRIKRGGAKRMHGEEFLRRRKEENK